MKQVALALGIQVLQTKYSLQQCFTVWQHFVVPSRAAVCLVLNAPAALMVLNETYRITPLGQGVVGAMSELKLKPGLLL